MSSTPLSITATVTPLPVLSCQISSAPMASRCHCRSLTPAAWAGTEAMPTSSIPKAAEAVTRARLRRVLLVDICFLALISR